MGRDSCLREFSDSLEQVVQYPVNLISTDSYPHQLQSYLTRLNDAETKLCCVDGKAKLAFWICEEQGCGEFRYSDYLRDAMSDTPSLGSGFKTSCVSDVDELGKLYKIDTNFNPGIKDPRCCFTFIHARHSRDRLLISRPMMSLLFTYHQVMPAFLDFVLTFGRREHGQELHYGGFRSESRLLDSSTRIPEIGRSGRDFRLCYNLKSVEHSPKQTDWPWSVRQTAIHHTFDIVTGRASWIVVKGDGLMENRVKEATDPSSRAAASQFDTNSRSFASSLNTHLIYIDWAGENWQSYIDFLEDEAQDKTRRVLSADVDRLPKSKVAALPTTPSPKLSQRSWSGLSSLATEKGSQMLSGSSHSWAKLPGKLRQFASTSYYAQRRTQEKVETAGGNDELRFYFADLQRAQYLEEKTNGAILVININLSVISEMKKFYQELLRADESSDEISMNCGDDVERFLRRASSAENDLRLQKSRAESLVRVLADRKNLLFGALEYHNMEASRLSAQSMHAVAQQTQQETVSMRIITLVTLFFLPATFICTLMSTDIIRWDSGDGDPQERTVSTGAIEFFFAITLPLSCCTFSAWWYFNRRLTRAQQAKDAAMCLV
ncbi:mitosis inhibitor protein kinase swe1 [Diplodia corticola]|uniref:Mitosis inhibitor protein kinase swe1 n=1 Tax=Diplodia corticola TaxID=236234 RepID=A0A1J9RKY6_9PEZI|nr:mitosis inhibitor protein kinase swe1 [Diplodia corticola]OJD33251.1 mitosis inhibitor protein kinase swe1 [Diplodia corticola]